MIIIKSVIHDIPTNSVEATWMNTDGAQIKCHSYADVQMQMLRDDALELGTPLTEYEELIALVESRIVPYVAPKQTQEQLRELAKISRADAVSRITVTTLAGNTFDGDETSQTRMARAIIVLQSTGTPTTIWVLHDNSAIQASAAELSEALALAGAAQGALWVLP